MDIQLLKVTNTHWKNSWETIYIKQGIAFLSEDNINTVLAFESRMKDPNAFKEVEAFPLSNVVEIVFSDFSSIVDLTFLNEQNVEKKILLDLKTADLASDFGTDLALEANLAKTTIVEKGWKNILNELLYIFVLLCAGVFVSTKINFSLFPTGKVLACIGVAILYFGYYLVKKYKRSRVVTTYSSMPQELSPEEAPLELKIPLMRGERD